MCTKMSAEVKVLPQKIDKIIKMYTSILLKHFREEIKALVLIGSWARGDARDDSDIDILCICSRKLMDKILTETSGFNADLFMDGIENSINIHFVFTELLDFSKDNEYLLLYYASREGIPLHGKSFWEKVKNWVLKTSILVGYDEASK